MMKSLQRIKKINDITNNKYWEMAEYVLNCMSIAAGLGNLWRFPYTTYLHNGGSFIFAYIVLYIVVGLPMVILNFGVGQFSGLATTKLWTNLGPGWRGIGITQCIIAMVCLYYYSFHSAIALRYACNAWRTKFDWGECDESVKKNCVPLYEANLKNTSFVYNKNLSSSAELYLTMHLLHSEVILDQAELGPPNFELCFYLGLVWVCNYMYTSIGVNRYTKVAFITGTLPYLMFMIFTIRVFFLPGAGQGLLLLLKPTLDSLISIDNWIAALMQCYFTLSISCGALTVFSANAAFDHNITRTVAIVMGCDLLLSAMSSMSVFSVLGYLSLLQKMEIKDVIKTYKFWCPYIAYTTGLVHIHPASSFFAFAFFLTIFIATLLEMSSLLQILVLNLHEWMSWFRRSYILTLLSCSCALLSIPCTTPEGTILATFSDLYGNLYCRAILVPLQIIAVCYTYGLKNWCWDYEYMQRKPANFFYRWTWAIFIPFILVVIYFGTIVSNASTIYNLGLLPYKMRIACFVFLTLSTLPIPIAMVYQLIINCPGCKDCVRRTFSSDMWWPMEPEFSDPMLRFRANKLRTQEWQRKMKPGKYARCSRPLFAEVP